MPLIAEPRAEAPRSPQAEATRGVPYVPDNLDDIDSEIVRHAEPLEETLARQNSSPEPMKTTTSGLDIQYDVHDLEVPAFLRKRGES